MPFAVDPEFKSSADDHAGVWNFGMGHGKGSIGNDPWMYEEGILWSHYISFEMPQNIV